MTRGGNSSDYMRAKEQLQALRAEVRRLKLREYQRDKAQQAERRKAWLARKARERERLRRDMLEQIRCGFPLAEMARMLSCRQRARRTEADAKERVKKTCQRPGHDREGLLILLRRAAVTQTQATELEPQFLDPAVKAKENQQMTGFMAEDRSKQVDHCSAVRIVEKNGQDEKRPRTDGKADPQGAVDSFQNASTASVTRFPITCIFLRSIPIKPAASDLLPSEGGNASLNSNSNTNSISTTISCFNSLTTATGYGASARIMRTKSERKVRQIVSLIR